MKRWGAKLAIVCLSVLALTALDSQKSSAKVEGDCEVCHAIYPGMMDEPAPRKDPRYALKNAVCVNCHSFAGNETVKILGGVRVPVVFNTDLPVSPLAGGNFYHVSRVFGDRKGHNVEGISAADQGFGGAPPGYERTKDPSMVGFNSTKPLACSGSNGCHGNRDIEDPFRAVLGTHHAEDLPLDGSTTAKSFRYLRITEKEKGILGLEDADWGRNESSVKHNEYTSSMNALCANCHGDFHGPARTGIVSPWFRHPTDVVLPKTGEYAAYNPASPPSPERPGIRIYNPDAPVGRAEVPGAVSDAVKPGEDIVLCLSCHRAHGSPYAASLRWDYDSIFTGGNGKGGCLICHTGKGGR